MKFKVGDYVYPYTVGKSATRRIIDIVEEDGSLVLVSWNKFFEREEFIWASDAEILEPLLNLKPGTKITDGDETWEWFYGMGTRGCWIADV